jgi:hypothetical protein
VPKIAHAAISSYCARLYDLSCSHVASLTSHTLARSASLDATNKHCSYELVRKFNLDTAAFDHNEVLARLDKMATSAIKSD